MLILPCRHFVPKQSHFVRVLIYTGSPRMALDLSSSAACLGLTPFYCDRDSEKKLVPCLDVSLVFRGEHGAISMQQRHLNVAAI